MVTCRMIEAGDIEAVVGLLTAGFGKDRDRSFWERALARLANRCPPEGFPRFGHLLDAGGTPVGVLLQIFVRMPGEDAVRCSLSSWYVVPKFRTYAPLLVSRALRPAATYVNATPARHTWPVLEAQGYTRYCNGRLVLALWLARRTEAARVARFTDAMADDARLAPADATILRDHASYGCLCLVGEAGGRLFPFIFLVRRHGPFGLAGLAGLVYCSTDAPLQRFARALGWFLLRRGIAFVGLDSDGALPGLPGRYFDGRPKYFKGPVRPRIGDHAYSERIIIGS